MRNTKPEGSRAPRWPRPHPTHLGMQWERALACGRVGSEGGSNLDAAPAACLPLSHPLWLLPLIGHMLLKLFLLTASDKVFLKIVLNRVRSARRQFIFIWGQKIGRVILTVTFVPLFQEDLGQ